MSNAHLRVEPHHIRGRDDVWWYEEPKGISIVIQGGESKGYQPGRIV